MRTLYLDCFAGISGNMFLGSLIDLGLPEQRLREELAKLPVGGYELVVKPVEKLGISATYLDVKTAKQHHHRHLPDIFKIIDNSALEQPVKDGSKQVFMRLAEAEAKVHGTTLEKIHFHEVGAVDAIVDIVGTVFGLHYLKVDRIYTSKLTTGTGYVKCSHGNMPIPAPATAELLRGIPYDKGEIAKELVTPTGAALVATLSNGNGFTPKDFVSEAIGYGAGTWDLIIPNVLRAVLGESGRSVPKADLTDPKNDLTPKGDLTVVEANIDDMNPQVYSYVMEKLFAVGVRDVWMTSIIMKKGRPATQLSVLADSEVLDKVFGVLFSETSTIGMRYYPVNRVVADRELIEVATSWGPVKAKISSYQGKVCNIAPEFDDCRRLAEDGGVPLKTVWQEALNSAWLLYGKAADKGNERH
ncbi:MAG: nickel pincer cofactor biosynthesis protein LarC [Negativicutes bacterium]|nr:nickel pincer cofactor biosynthesis protein LarC [Negativicutes bacterium]